MFILLCFISQLFNLCVNFRLLRFTFLFLESEPVREAPIAHLAAASGETNILTQAIRQDPSILEQHDNEGKDQGQGHNDEGNMTRPEYLRATW